MRCGAEGGLGMSKVLRNAQAGLVKKGDVLVELFTQEAGNGIAVEISSPVKQEFGAQIEATVRAVLLENQVEDCLVRLEDKGAMDFALRARMETAVRRATSEVQA